MYNWASYIQPCRIKSPRADMIYTVLSVLYILLHVILFLIRGSPGLTHNGVRRSIMEVLYTCNFALMYTNNQNMGEKKTRRFMSVGWSFSFDLNRQIILLFHHHDLIDVTHVHAPSRVSILIIAILSTLLLTIFPKL